MTDTTNADDQNAPDLNEFSKELAALLAYVKKGLDPTLARKIFDSLISKYNVPDSLAKKAEADLEIAIDEVVRDHEEVERQAREHFDQPKPKKPFAI